MQLQCSLREVKFAREGEAMTFTGYGAVFGNIDSYGDVIEAGAFAETIAGVKRSGRWPSMLLQHGGFTADDQTPIGVWTDLAEDGTGLWVEGTLAPTERGKEAYALLKMQPRPALDGLSIGYRPVEFEMGTKPSDARRKLKKVDLVEISLVTFPANPKARVKDVKSTINTIREFEAFLRDAGGYSAAEAKALASHGFKALARDAGTDTSTELADALRGLTDILNK